MRLADVKERGTRSRLFVLAVVAAAHAAVFIFLISLRVPPRADRNEYVSLLWLHLNKPPEIIPQPVRPSTVVKRTPQGTLSVGSPSASSLAESQSDPQRPIDWAQEAAREAGALTSNAITLPQSGRQPRPTLSPFEPHPVHHAGDSYRNESGETIVCTSDKCYQVSATMLTVPDVMTHAMIPRTICPRSSNKPRGDLFKDIPAYRKLHPDDDNP